MLPTSIVKTTHSQSLLQMGSEGVQLHAMLKVIYIQHTLCSCW